MELVEQCETSLVEWDDADLGVVADFAADPVIVAVPGNASDHVPSHGMGLVTNLGILYT